MNKSKFALIGTSLILAAGAVYYGFKYFKKKKGQKSVQEVKDESDDQKESDLKKDEPEIKDEHIASSLSSKDLTLADTKDRYVQSNNSKMLLITHETEKKLKLTGMIPEFIETKSIWELCEWISKKNKDSRERLHAQLIRLRGDINAKPGRTFLMFVPLRDEPTDSIDEMAFTIKYTPKHIKEGLDRLNAIVYKYRDSTHEKLYEEHYIELLYHLLVQFEDIRNVERILPSRFATHPDVNLIGEILKNNNYNKYIHWYSETFGEEKLKEILTEDKERYLVNWVGKDPLKAHLQTADEMKTE